MKTQSHLDLLASLLIGPPDLALLDDRESWESVKQHASSYGVGPLIAYVVRPHVPASERVWCDRILVESWQRHERMLAQLGAVLDLLESVRVPAMALKGPALARRYYEPPFLRKPSLDLDLAIADQHLERATEALMSAGYSLDWPLAYARAHSHHVELSHQSRPHLELHFRLTHRALGIRVEEFFARAITQTLPGGREILVPGPADQLLHLVLHLAQSRFGTLFHLLEIQRVWNAEALEARTEAIRRGSAHGYRGAFHMMDVAFRARLKQPFLPDAETLSPTWLQGKLTPALYRQFEEWSLPGRALSARERVYARWLDFQLTDSPRDALRLALFFVRTAAHTMGSKRLWGTPKHLRFAPQSRMPVAPEKPAAPLSMAQDDFSLTRRGR